MTFSLFVIVSFALASGTTAATWLLRRRMLLAAGAAFTGASALLLLHGPGYFDYYADDSFITLRYSRNLAEGLGPNWNAEGRVEGYTTFLWMALLAAFAKLGFDLVSTSIALGFAALLATFVAVLGIWRLWSRAAPDSGVASPIVLVGALLGLALADGVAFWGFSGMETALFAALVSASAFLYMHERHRGALAPYSAVAVAAAAMTRPEGAVVAAVTGCFILADAARQRDRRWAASRLMLWAATFLFLYGSYFAWRFAYYGYLFPNTYYAKVGLTADTLERGMEYVFDYGLRYHVLPMLGGAALLLAQPRLRRDALYVIAIAGSLIGAMVVEGGGGDEHGRFFVPLLPLLFVTGLAGLATAVQRLAMPRAQSALVTSMALAFGGLALLPASEDALIPLGQRGIEQRQQLATWFNDHTPPDYEIADFMVGATAYYAEDRDILDLFGLNDITIAHTDVPDMGGGIAGHEKYNIDYVLDEARPEIVVIGETHALRMSDEEIEARLRRPTFLRGRDALFTDERLWERYRVRAVELRGQWYHFLQRSDTVHELQAHNLD